MFINENKTHITTVIFLLENIFHRIILIKKFVAMFRFHI